MRKVKSSFESNQKVEGIFGFMYFLSIDTTREVVQCTGNLFTIELGLSEIIVPANWLSSAR